MMVINDSIYQTFIHRIHSSVVAAAEDGGEVRRVGQRGEHANGRRTVHVGGDLVVQRLLVHDRAPHLRSGDDRWWEYNS